MEVTKAFQFVADSYRGLDGGKLFFFILGHNVTASILILVSSVLIGIIPIFSMGSNGFSLGVLYRQTAKAAGYSKAALKVLPYGVFEIPALLIAASYGLWLGVMVVRRMRDKESMRSFQIPYRASLPAIFHPFLFLEPPDHPWKKGNAYL